MKENTVKYELATLENYESRITVNSLKRNVGKILKAGQEINKNEWTVAIAVNNIVEGEQYKKDFETMEKFSEWMGFKGNYAGRTSKAVKCMVNTLNRYGLTVENCSYSKAYRLAQVEKDIDRFIAFAKTQGYPDLLKISVHQLEDLIKAFKKPEQKALENAGEQENAESTETDEKKENKFTGLYDEKGVWFEVNGKKYTILFDELKKYIVK